VPLVQAPAALCVCSRAFVFARAQSQQPAGPYPPSPWPALRHVPPVSALVVPALCLVSISKPCQLLLCVPDCCWPADRPFAMPLFPHVPRSLPRHTGVFIVCCSRHRSSGCRCPLLPCSAPCRRYSALLTTTLWLCLWWCTCVVGCTLYRTRVHAIAA
jgi:hypothetical protein